MLAILSSLHKALISSVPSKALFESLCPPLEWGFSLPSSSLVAHPALHVTDHDGSNHAINLDKPDCLFGLKSFDISLGIVMGNPGVFQSYLHPYPPEPAPVARVEVFAGLGRGFNGFCGL